MSDMPTWPLDERGGLVLNAAPLTDLFVDPRATKTVLHAQPVLATVSGDLVLSARVGVDFKATFDAAVLVVWTHEHAWAKLCFEYSPQGQPMVVSVVTRGVSDDCNSFVVDGTLVWLRVARVSPAFAFHASLDGQQWEFVRHFAFDAPEAVDVGFLAQSPTGQGCAATFDTIRFERRALADLRNGE